MVPVRAQCGLVVSRPISMPASEVRSLNQTAPLSGNCVSGPTKPDIRVAGVRKWGAHPVMTPVNSDAASVPIAGEM